MNNCTFIGRMTKDPVKKIVPINGVETRVLNFYIAVDDGFGDYKKTDFIHVTAWRGAADAISQYMTKGREIAIKGAVHLETYEKDGEKRTTLAMPRPEGFEFLGRKVQNEVAETDECPWEE